MGRVLQPYSKEELRDMRKQGDIDMGLSPEGSDQASDGVQENDKSGRHDKVFVPKLGWVDQSVADLEGN